MNGNHWAFVKGCGEVLAARSWSNDLGNVAANTEASVFQKLGIECPVFSPGMSVGNSHASNESMILDDLEVEKFFYRNVLERFCL